MRTTISVRDETVRRVDGAARRLGISRGEFFAKAAERWLDALDDDTTAAINDAIAEVTDDHAFTDTAAAVLPLDEVRQLAADEADVEEMQIIRKQLADLHHPCPD